jgi:hypothetical protein
MRKKLRLDEALSREALKEYGFFYHKPTDDYWLVLNKKTRNRNNVESSLRVNRAKEIKLYVTNDHKKLPSIFSPQFNAKNYLEFEEKIDQFSFADYAELNVLFEMIANNLVVLK